MEKVISIFTKLTYISLKNPSLMENISEILISSSRERSRLSKKIHI